MSLVGTEEPLYNFPFGRGLRGFVLLSKVIVRIKFNYGEEVLTKEKVA